jgi:hypothetical protein
VSSIPARARRVSRRTVSLVGLGFFILKHDNAGFMHCNRYFAGVASITNQDRWIVQGTSPPNPR